MRFLKGNDAIFWSKQAILTENLSLDRKNEGHEPYAGGTGGTPFMKEIIIYSSKAKNMELVVRKIPPPRASLSI